MFQPRVLLHPTDYSDCARYAFEVAVDLAIHHHAKLLVLHVAETLGPEMVSHGEASTQRQPASNYARLLQQLTQHTPSSQEIPIEHLLAEGDPGTAIVETAGKHGCDLIVLGTYGRSVFSHLLTGSVTQKVKQLASCAIITVRMPAPPSARSPS